MKSTLRIIRGFQTISEEAAGVIADLIPIDIFASEIKIMLQKSGWFLWKDGSHVKTHTLTRGELIFSFQTD